MRRSHATRWAWGLWLSTAGCATTPGTSAEPGAAECSVRLPPKPGTDSPAPTPTSERPTPPSLIVVHAETPLAALKQMLEQRVQARLAEGRVRIGPGGTVTYSAERGALMLSVTRTALLVETAVRARAEACRGSNCYASCEPEALVRAEVPLMLRADYRFQKAAVTLTFTRGCEVRTLGGLLTVDITPTLRSALQPELDQVAREIDQNLPDVTAQVSKAWFEVLAPRELPLGGCFVAQPFGVVQGPLTPSTEVLRARFALLATPELRASCGAPALAQPLPPLTTDISLAEEGVIRLGLVTPLASVEHAFVAAAPITASGDSVRITQAHVTARGSDVDAELLLGGRVCGGLALAARLDFPADGQFIGLTGALLSAGERERLSAAELDATTLGPALAAAPRIAPLISVAGFRESAPALAAALSPPTLDVSAKVSSARGAGAVARGAELVALLEARGALWIKPR